MSAMQLVLRQVRRFTHRRSQVFDNGTRWASPRGLPTEILLQIISYLMSDLRDVAVLNRTSKYFTAVTDALLYSSLRIGLGAPSCKPMSVPLNERRQALLYQGLQSPRFAELVTEFRIDFSWCGMRRPPILRRLRRVRCTCNRLDYLLGQALTSLTNLRILRFSCYCCADPTDSRHLYLQHLTTTKLRGLTFECQCMPAMSDKLFNICSASCMRSLLELKWPNPGNSAPNVSVRALIEDKKCLPKLVGLYIHDNVEAVSSILEKGIVKYLRCDVVNERLQELLDKHPGTLRSLRVKKKRITLPAKIAERPDTYRCLIRIGKLFYPSNEIDRILEYLQPLTCLPELRVIDVLHDRALEDTLNIWKNEDDDALVPRLGTQHPSLRKIYLTMPRPNDTLNRGSEYSMWSSEGDSDWRLQPISQESEMIG